MAPGILLSLYMANNPLNANEWKVMASVLKNEFGESCYMSCGLLKTKSTIIQQFQGNAGKYSFEVIFRYSLIVLIGFYPISLLLKNCTTKSKKLFFFSKFQKSFNAFLYFYFSSNFIVCHGLRLGKMGKYFLCNFCIDII